MMALELLLLWGCYEYSCLPANLGGRVLQSPGLGPNMELLALVLHGVCLFL